MCENFVGGPISLPNGTYVLCQPYNLNDELGWPILKKWLMRMYITCFFLVSVLLQMSLASNAQQVTLQKDRAALQDIFGSIKKQTGFDFVYKNEVLKKSKPVDINVTDLPLKEALDRCFAHQPLTYTIKNRTIVVQLKEAPLSEENIQ